MPLANPIKFTLVSLGCAKNQVDSEALIAFLEGEGARWVSEPAEADWVLVNSCGFIAEAKEESIRTTLELKAGLPGKRVLMLGCLVERHGEELRRELTEIDAFCGTLRSAGFRGVLAALAEGAAGGEAGRPAEAAPAAAPAEPPVPRRRLLTYPGSAFVKVAEGCNNRCTYCAIPLIRGELASREPAAVVAEIRGLLERGALAAHPAEGAGLARSPLPVREINLVAQDLASYGRDRGEAELEALLAGIAAIEGDFWLRLLYLHPDHFPFGVLPLLARDPRFLPYFDIPFQHASPRVLARMGRRGSAESHLELLARVREALPGAAFRSTFLLGFPGEEEEDFRRLLDFQQAARLDWVGAFAYSREEGTAAWRLPGRVRAAEARRRVQALQQAQQPISEARLSERVGGTVDVLVEEEMRGGGLPGEGGASGGPVEGGGAPEGGEPMYLGRAWFQAPEVDGLVVLRGAGAGAVRPGDLVRVRLVRRNGLDLEAVPLDGAADPRRPPR